MEKKGICFFSHRQPEALFTHKEKQQQAQKNNTAKTTLREEGKREKEGEREKERGQEIFLLFYFISSNYFLSPPKVKSWLNGMGYKTFHKAPGSGNYHRLDDAQIKEQEQGNYFPLFYLIFFFFKKKKFIYWFIFSCKNICVALQHFWSSAKPSVSLPPRPRPKQQPQLLPLPVCLEKGEKKKIEEEKWDCCCCRCRHFAQTPFHPQSSRRVPMRWPMWSRSPQARRCTTATATRPSQPA